MCHIMQGSLQYTMSSAVGNLMLFLSPKHKEMQEKEAYFYLEQVYCSFCLQRSDITTKDTKKGKDRNVKALCHEHKEVGERERDREICFIWGNPLDFPLLQKHCLW